MAAPDCLGESSKFGWKHIKRQLIKIGIPEGELGTVPVEVIGACHIYPQRIEWVPMSLEPSLQPLNIQGG